MTRTFLRSLAGLIVLLMLSGWGFWAHKRINHLAVFTLPPGMFIFYKTYIDYLTGHAVDADKRRYVLDEEAPRHFIDLDQYTLDSLPRTRSKAIEKFGEDTLKAHGILPWHILHEYYLLTDAFRKKQTERILRISADLGHYLADAHVPLHTTKNYNGQLTGQKGIHGFWESRIPELYADGYDFFVGTADYVANPSEEIWKIILESHAAVDSVLSFESALQKDFPPDRKYGYEGRENMTVRVYSRDYSFAYHQRLNGQVARRMQLAVKRIGSFWYSAWADAGRPDLDVLIRKKTFGFPDFPDRKDKKILKEDRENESLD